LVVEHRCDCLGNARPIFRIRVTDDCCGPSFASWQSGIQQQWPESSARPLRLADEIDKDLFGARKCSGQSCVSYVEGGVSASVRYSRPERSKELKNLFARYGIKQ